MNDKRKEIPLLGSQVLYRKPGDTNAKGQAGQEQHALERALHAGVHTRCCSLCGLQFGLKGMPPAEKYAVLEVKGQRIQLYRHQGHCPVRRQ